jgi:hypothetical protein
LTKDEGERNEVRWRPAQSFGARVHLRLVLNFEEEKTQEQEQAHSTQERSKPVRLRLGPVQKIPVKRQGHLTQEGWKRVRWRPGHVLKKPEPMRTLRWREVRNWDGSEGLGLNFEEQMKPVRKRRVLVHLKQVREDQVWNLRKPTTGCYEVPSLDD